MYCNIVGTVLYLYKAFKFFKPPIAPPSKRKIKIENLITALTRFIQVFNKIKFLFPSQRQTWIDSIVYTTVVSKNLYLFKIEERFKIIKTDCYCEFRQRGENSSRFGSWQNRDKWPMWIFVPNSENMFAMLSIGVCYCCYFIENVGQIWEHYFLFYFICFFIINFLCIYILCENS